MPSFVIEALVGSALFSLNKIKYGEVFNIERNIHLKIQQAENISFYTAIDENGILRGGELPWSYLHDLIPESITEEKDKIDYLCRVLSKLPSNVAFSFAARPDLKDAEIVKKAFFKSGFVYNEKKTLLFKGSAYDGDLVKRFKSDVRSKINAGIRDLEVVAMSVDEFFKFYKNNLATAKKESYFNLDIDQKLIAEAVKLQVPCAHILAVRQKAKGPNGEDAPVDAAIICAGGPDGYLKLLRITYRHEVEGVSPLPHKHATKYLVYEAMKLAIEKGLTLDTDGFTPGGDILYSRFGVFEASARDEFKRKTAQTFLKKLVKH